MQRRIRLCVTVGLLCWLAGCGGGRIPFPSLYQTSGGTTGVSPAFGQAGAVPQGLQVVFLSDVILVRGSYFIPGIKVFFGMNGEIARRPNSLMTTDRHLLPETPFVYTDPVTQQETILEVEADVQYISKGELLVTIPPACACSPLFTNPVVRLYGEAGSSIPETDVYYIVGTK